MTSEQDATKQSNPYASPEILQTDDSPQRRIIVTNPISATRFTLNVVGCFLLLGLLYVGLIVIFFTIVCLWGESWITDGIGSFITSTPAQDYVLVAGFKHV